MASTMRPRPRHLLNTLKQIHPRIRASPLRPLRFNLHPTAKSLHSSANLTRASSMCHRPPPPSTWDSHMHIVSPDTTTYPLSPTTQYTPHPHTIADYRAFLSTLPLSLDPTTTTTTHATALFVQPSPYGHSNALLLSALRSLPAASARGIVVLPPLHSPDFPSPTTLEDWHGAGVRGVRVNLVSVGREVGREELLRELGGLAERIRGVGGGEEEEGWVLQLYVPLRMCEDLEGMVEGLGVRVVVDHMGSPDLPASGGVVDVEKLPGFAALRRMVEQGRTWVKVSGWYRLSKAPGAAEDGLVRDEWLDAVGRGLIGARGGTRVVWASDWPHTRFEEQEVDVRGFVERCWRWCEAVAQEKGETADQYARRLFVENAAELWK